MDVNVFTETVGKVFGFVASIMKRLKIWTSVQAQKQTSADRYSEPKCGISKCHQTQE